MRLLSQLSFLFLLAFAFAIPFSIAFAQISLGLSLICFLPFVHAERNHLWTKSLRAFWIAIAAYVFWLAVACAWSRVPSIAFASIKEEWLFLIIPLCVGLIDSKKKLFYVFIALASGAALFAFYGMLQHYWLVHVLDLTVGRLRYLARVTGTFSITITYASVYSIISVGIIAYALTGLCRSMGIRSSLLAIGLACAIAGILTGSRIAPFAIVAGWFVAFTSLGRRAVLLTAVATLLFAGFVLALPTTSARFGQDLKDAVTPTYGGSRPFIWKQTMAIVAEYPVVGVGPGHFRENYVRHAGEVYDIWKFDHAHNDVLNLAAVAGIPGAGLYLIIWFSFVRMTLAAYRSVPGGNRLKFGLLIGLAASAAYFTCSLTESTFADEEVRQTLFLFWGVGAALVSRWPEIGLTTPAKSVS